jgi:hypothetical protein
MDKTRHIKIIFIRGFSDLHTIHINHFDRKKKGLLWFFPGIFLEFNTHFYSMILQLNYQDTEKVNKILLRFFLAQGHGALWRQERYKEIEIDFPLNSRQRSSLSDENLFNKFYIISTRNVYLFT